MSEDGEKLFLDFEEEIVIEFNEREIVGFVSEFDPVVVKEIVFDFVDDSSAECLSVMQSNDARRFFDAFGNQQQFIIRLCF